MPEEITKQEKIKTPEIPAGQKQEIISEQKQKIQPKPKSTGTGQYSVPPVQSQKQQGQKNPQIKKLCDLAFSDGIDEAIKQAEKTNKAYILDELHDTLIDELRTKLIQVGKLKE